ncbi:MAG TPA: P1 family peptidase [Chloroflexota bacterium]|nr:P1 family peptidase [Chloroflexota bacterium]
MNAGESGEAREFLLIGGIRVGHWTDEVGGTGCTVLVCDPPACGGVDIRGSAPGTRETALLTPTGSVQTVNAIVLTGGSALGLAAASGVATALHAAGKGYPTSQGPIPIVPAAVIYDLGLGGVEWPDERAGRAALAAASDDGFAVGNVGAGIGATAGAGPAGTKTGLGLATLVESNLRVGALVVANPLGSIVAADGRVLAGQRDGGGLVHPEDVLRLLAERQATENTVIGCVVTNARLAKTAATKVAQMAHDGIARAVQPAHTTRDGDTLFAVSVGEAALSADLDLVGDLASRAVSAAIRNAALNAETAYGIPSARDLATR